MYIKKIKVKNFRLLKDLVIDLQDELSLVVGKNNVGKTSLLVVLDKFLNSNNERTKKFQFYDFNLDCQNEIEKLIDEKIVENEYRPIGIQLRIIVKYTDSDSLDNIGNKILTNLEEDNNYFALGFDYILELEGCIRMIEDYNKALTDFKERHKNADDNEFDKHEFLKSSFQKYFKIQRKSIYVNKDTMELDEGRCIKLDGLPGFRMDDVINFEYISARRNVDNKELDHTLSGQTSELYKTQENNEENIAARENFIASLKDTDKVLTEIYSQIFQEPIEKISLLGGMRPNETTIKIISTLQHQELLKNNTTVVYKHDDRDLPESYNGLGYLNLISMIFEISLIVERMKRVNSRRPADINLLFIEEPEAHTHPQMQYIFIKNIKKLLSSGIVRNDGAKAPLQYIVSTHSSHIVSDSSFEDIKYLKRIEGQNAIEAKNLHDLERLYVRAGKDGEEDKIGKASYRFLKQYLTLTNSELFFADKAIFVEGDTERILVPLMMQKVDEECGQNGIDDSTPLLSQNISVLPIGAHSHIFEKFFHFIGLEKLLVLTDLDICSPDGHHQKCRYEDGKNLITSNAALKHYFSDDKISSYLNKTFDDKQLCWDDNSMQMIPHKEGNMTVCYQTKEGTYQPRSFEDNFFSLNTDFIIDSINEGLLDKSAFNQEKALSDFKEDKDAYKLAENVKSKAALAISLILAESDDKRWKVPTYIKEGLLWIKK